MEKIYAFSNERKEKDALWYNGVNGIFTKRDAFAAKIRFSQVNGANIQRIKRIFTE